MNQFNHKSRNKTSINKTSINSRIRTLIWKTVLLLVITGCTIAILIFVNILRIDKTNQIKTVMNTFYDISVTDTKDKVRNQADKLSKVLGLQDNLNDQSIYNQELFKEIYSDIEFTIYTMDYQVCYATSGDLFTSNEDAGILKKRDDAFLATTNNVIQYFYKMPIYDNQKNISGYVITSDDIVKQEFFDYIKTRFNVEASIFYKDIRVNTTIKKDEKLIIGTKLDTNIAEKLLKKPTVYSGFADILGQIYITSYKSFGTDGDAPVGIVFVGLSILQYSKILVEILLAVAVLGAILVLLSLKISDKWLNKNIVKPMRDTSEFMAKIAEGDLNFSETMNHPIQYEEFKQLYFSVNKMLMNLKESKEETERLAYYDDLTGMPNRFQLLRKKKKSLPFAQNPNSIILFDIDDLNIVNDLYGTKIGDILITEIAKFVTSEFDEEKILKTYRISGGTFAILSEEKDEEAISKKVKHLMKRFKTSFICDDVSLKTTISVGIALKNQEEKTVQDLLHYAELAMREVKKSIKNNYMFYRDEVSENIHKQKEMEEDIKTAMKRGEFYLVYQPKFNLKTKCFDSFEALIRWNSPSRGFVSPGEFIDSAEKSGLIVPIGKWVLEEACNMVKYLSEKMNFPYKVAVNISPIQINREDFFDTIVNTLIQCNLESSQLELEITENLLMTSFSDAVSKLRQLYVLGVSISVDDFGKGYSSLAYLQQLPIHTLKIDKMFIDAIEDGEETMVGDIIRLGHNMQLQIVAEGVESVAQLEYLELAGCDSIQGYYYSKPLALPELEEFIKLSS